MQKMISRSLAGLLLMVLTSCNSGKDFELLEVKQLKNYPSGSAIAFFKDRLFLVGDDVPFLLVLDKSFEVIDSIPIVADKTQRIAKDIKPDFEAIASIQYNKQPALLLLGSGSKDPYRNNALVLNKTNTNISFKLDSFYNRLKRLKIRDLNVEGAASIPGGILLSSRGNKGFRKNYLAYVSSGFFAATDSSDIKLIKVGTSTDTSVFNGVSGLDYAAQSDKLLLTVSTENTYDSYADGSIGKSYLWIINDITTRKRFSNINPDRILDLEELDGRFKGHKIESVCVVSETRRQMELVLVSDNDRGDTWLFRVLLQK